MAAKLTRPTHKILIQLHVVAESYNICSSSSRRTVRKFWIHPRVYVCVRAQNVRKPYCKKPLKNL